MAAISRFGIETPFTSHYKQVLSSLKYRLSPSIIGTIIEFISPLSTSNKMHSHDSIVDDRCIPIFASLQGSQSDESNNYSITRQFHDCVFDHASNELIVFGGYGTNDQQLIQKHTSSFSKLPRKRLNDIIHCKYDPVRNVMIHQSDKNIDALSPSKLTPNPKSRQHHSVVMLKNKTNESMMFLFGGRSNPLRPFGDFWIYDIAKRQWNALNVNQQNMDDVPCPRFRHSLCALSDDEVLVFGGITVNDKTPKLLNDMFVITVDFDTLSVECKRISNGWDAELRGNGNQSNDEISNEFGSVPSPRCSMTMELVNMNNDPPLTCSDSNSMESIHSHEWISKVLVFGGLTTLDCFAKKMCSDSRVYIFDLKDRKWNVMKVLNDGPRGIYGHSSCIAKDGKSVIISGGVLMENDALRYNEFVWRLDLKTRLWNRFVIGCSMLRQQINIGHCMIYFGCDETYDIVWLIGGGVNVFSFGAVYGSVIQLCLPMIGLQ